MERFGRVVGWGKKGRWGGVLGTVEVFSGIPGTPQARPVLKGVQTPQLFGVTPTDPLTFLLTPLVVVGIALVANLLPARRAVRVDPVRALQAD